MSCSFYCDCCYFSRLYSLIKLYFAADIRVVRNSHRLRRFSITVDDSSTVVLEDKAYPIVNQGEYCPIYAYD